MKKLLWSMLLMFGFMINIEALDFELSKVATKDDIKYGREVDVTLSVKANPINQEVTKDIILVIDRSTSMNSSMSSTKEIAKNLIDSLVDDRTKVGIVTYGTKTLMIKELSNNKNTIKNNLDLIPNYVYNEGTNIEAGLRSANTLLANSRANIKVVILLTDGKPTFYYEEKNDKLILKGDGENYSVQGEINARAQIDLLKSNNVSVYNVGFKIEKNSKQDIFLRESATKYYNPQSIGELKNDLNNISITINSITNNATVIDIIPSNFKIKEISKNIKQDVNEDGTVKLTWNIGNIVPNTYYKLDYKLEAIDSDYGSMYTNEEAILTGNYVKTHPLYSNEKFNFFFNKPYAPIPMITKDDNYIEKYVSNLEIPKDKGILINDSLNLNTDESNEITKKINVYNLSCGKNLKINSDGSFSIDTLDCSNISFEYSVTNYIEYDDELVEVESNKSKVNIEIIPKNSYIVKYLNIDNNEEIISSKIVSTHLNETVVEKYVDILYYTLVNDKEQSIKINEKDNEIIFYYKKNTDKYTVNYYYDGILDESSIEILEGTIGSKVESYPNKIKKGYELSKVENLPLIIGTDNKINVYYNSIKEDIPNTGIQNSNNLLICVLFLSLTLIRKILK